MTTGPAVKLLLIIAYIAAIALGLWIGYLIIRKAVTDGILRADSARTERSGPPPESSPLAPAGWYPVPGGRRYWDGQESTSTVVP